MKKRKERKKVCLDLLLPRANSLELCKMLAVGQNNLFPDFLWAWANSLELCKMHRQNARLQALGRSVIASRTDQVLCR